jgi:membrane protein
VAEIRLQQCWQIAKAAFRNLVSNDIARMAGATAFFATFAIPPILMIIVRTIGLFVGKRNVGRSLIDALRNIFGEESTASIIQTIRSFRALEHNYLIAAGIFIFLLFVATSFFGVIRSSINQLWCIRTATKARLLSILKERVTAIAVILAGGLIFLSIQLLVAGQALLEKQLNTFNSTASAIICRGINILIRTTAATLWLFLLFCFLPDGRPNRKIALTGAVLTGILFTIGKAVLRILLQPVQVNNFYGISGAIALVLLFMFYSSIFLYIGAALIGALSSKRGKPIEPKAHAERYKINEDNKSENC